MLYNNPIENVMTTTMTHLKNLSDVETVIGKPITLPDNSMLIPVSKVSVGFLAGGGEYSEQPPKKRDVFPFATGSGAGVSVVPIGFLHTSITKSEFIPVKEENDTLSDFIVSAINTFKKGKSDEK